MIVPPLTEAQVVTEKKLSATSASKTGHRLESCLKPFL